MRALLPNFCRPVGYAILFLALFLPFGLFYAGSLVPATLAFYLECSKLLMMLGALLILLAVSKHEGRETETIRCKATTRAALLTVLFVIGTVFYQVLVGKPVQGDSSAFLSFLIFNVLLLEFGMKKAQVDKMFKK